MNIDDIELPDPQDGGIPDAQFVKRIDAAWDECDRLEVWAEIWRGRTLRTIRDREKRDASRGSGFIKYLKRKGMTKTRAYALIALANETDALLDARHLTPKAIGNFSKQAFVEMTEMPETQSRVKWRACGIARRGRRVTRLTMRDLISRFE